MFARSVKAGLVVALAIACVPTSASADWLSRIVRGAGEIGEAGTHAGKALKLSIPSLEAAAAYVAKLPPASKGAALAAHATPEGHWKFVSREGEIFTAASPEELARAASVLAPEAAGGKLALHLTEDTVFGQRTLLKDLPQDADLYVVHGNSSYRLRGNTADPSSRLTAEVSPAITVELAELSLFKEAVFHLSRPLNRSNIRVLALAPGGPKQLASVPRFDPVTQGALVDDIDPGSLAAALGKLKGQTVLVSGRVDGDTLAYAPASGPEQKLFIRDLAASAEAADVNLVLVNAAASRQPGGRNWFWQKVEVAGLDEALRRATFADFLSSLGAKGGELSVSARPANQGRITLRAVPVGDSPLPLSGTIEEWMGEITGHVVSKAVEVHTRDEARQRELDARFIPGIPSAIQIGYVIALVLGVIGIGVAAPWWRRIWPPEQRDEYNGAIGYHAARIARLLAFVVVFLPIAGAPAFLWSLVLQIYGVLMLPFRAVGWLHSRLFARPG